MGDGLQSFNSCTKAKSAQEYYTKHSSDDTSSPPSESTLEQKISDVKSASIMF